MHAHPNPPEDNRRPPAPHPKGRHPKDPHPMPPYPVGVLADLHAGALDEGTAAHIRAHLDDDARTVLAALDRTTADLGRWAPQPEAAPAEVLARSRATLAALLSDRPGASERRDASHRARTATRPGATDPATHRRRPRKQRPRERFSRGRFVTAAAVAAVVVGGVMGGGGMGAGGRVGPLGPPSTDPPPGPPPDTAAFAVTPAERSVLLTALGSPTPAFGTNAELRGCTRANGIAEDTPIAGSAPVRLRGRDAVVILVTTGTAGRFTALVVGSDCGPGNPSTITETTIGG